MDAVRIVLGVVLPFVALVVFVGGMIYRLSTWRKLASPAMTLFPAPAPGGATTMNTLKEALLFKSLFHGDRMLWAFAWVFHAVLLLVFLGHFRVFTPLIDNALIPIIGVDGVHAMSAGAGGAAGVVILGAVALLFIRRMSVQRAREVTGVTDYLALLLIAAVIMTGNKMRFGGDQYHGFLDQTRDFFWALMTFSSGVTTHDALMDNLFLVHMTLALLLIMAIPFSKILHLGGIFFTHQLIRK